MPPKGKGKQRTVPTRPRQRLTKAAKENNITNDQEELISEAFQLFALKNLEGYEDEEYGVLKVQDIRRVLSALEIPSATTSTARNDLDPDFTGYVTYGAFLPYASSHINLGGQSASDEDDDGAHMQEVQSAYDLFTLNGPGPISIAHLRRVARQLKETVTDEQLASMVKVANGRTSEKNGWQAGVTLGEFEKVMAEAGVWKR